MAISFGDNVRILSTPATEAAGLAGLAGRVYGLTTPSVTHVTVIGEVTEDFALNVFFEERNQSFWFSEALLEFLDHAPGSTIQVAGVPKKWVREASGDWVEMSGPSRPSLWQRFKSWFMRNG